MESGVAYKDHTQEQTTNCAKILTYRNNRYLKKRMGGNKMRKQMA